MNYDYTRSQLRQLIVASGLTQQAFAQKCGLSQSSVARFLSGKRRPHLETLVKVCRAFHLEIQHFIQETRSDPPSRTA